MWVRSIVKGSIPRTGDERFDSAAGRSIGIVVWLSSDCRNWRCNTRRADFLASVSSRTSIWKQFRPYDTPQVVAGQARGRREEQWNSGAVKGNSRTVARSNPHDHFRLTLHAPRSLGFAVDAARRAGYPWTEQMSRKLSRKVRETPSSSSQKRPERSAERPPTLWHQRQLVQDPVAPELDGRLVEISRDS